MSDVIAEGREFRQAREQADLLVSTVANVDRSEAGQELTTALTDAEVLCCYSQVDPGSISADELRAARERITSLTA